jgi:hypothetical protein
MTKDLEKQQVIEPEIINEQGENITRQKEDCDFSRAAGRSVLTVFGGLLATLAGIAMFILFLAVAIIVAVPLLILSLFGKKPNVKVFKYRI